MNRYYWFVITLFLLVLVFFSGKSAHASLPLLGRTIVVDAGHGGLDPGAIYNDIYEKDITLKIGKYLEEYLTKMGATVVMTRTDDNDLSNGTQNKRKKKDFDERIKIINDKKIDMYVSIHLNFLENSRYYGPQVFYNYDNKDLADFIQKYLNKQLKGKRNVKSIPSNTYMYKRLKRPGLLIECGFLSNAEERNKLTNKSYQQKFAQSLAEAISHYYN